MSNRACPDYSWGYNHCPGPDREPGNGDDSCCWKCLQVKEIEALRFQVGEMRKALLEIKETGYRANPYDNCARIAEAALTSQGN